MAAIPPGRICIKTRGKNAGKEVVVKRVEKPFVIVENEKGKEQRVSLKHIEPTLKMKK